MRRRILIISAAAAVVAAAVLAGRAPRTLRPEVLTVSPPRTVAVLPRDGSTWCRWAGNGNLVVWYQFDSRYPGTRRKAGSYYGLGGIVHVDLTTGRATIVRAPRPVGESAETVYTWPHPRGLAAAIPLPPVVIGDRGALSYGRPMPSPAGDLMTYTAAIRGPDIFQTARTRETGFWISRPDGSHAVQVAPWFASPKDWSPDGRLVAFASINQIPGAGLWVCRRDGSGLRRVAIGEIYDARFSPDSRRLAYTKIAANHQLAVFVTDPHPGGRTKVVAGDARRPAWLGGSLLCLTRRQQIAKRQWYHVFPWVRRPSAAPVTVESLEAIDLKTGHRTTIEPLDAAVGYWWMLAPPKETGVLFLRAGDPGKEVNLVCAVTPYGVQRRTLGTGMALPAWSPDGKRLAYIEGSEIKVVEVGLKRVRRR